MGHPVRFLLGVACIVLVLIASLTTMHADTPLSEAQERGLKPKDIFKECDSCPEMVVIPAGEFTMGSSEIETARKDDEGPQRQVRLARPIAVSKLEITVDQFAAFVDAAGYQVGSTCWTFEDGKGEERHSRSFRLPGFPQTGAHPAACINWDDAKAYVAWLARATGRPYRLLTEAEWEYAARAGSVTPFFFGENEKDLCRYANSADLTAKKSIPDWTVVSCTDGYAFTAPGGSFAPNNFGLYDMLGNVWEWVEDCYHSSYQGAPADGSTWTSGDCTHRVLRGGSWWLVHPGMLRTALRSRDLPVDRGINYGFRVARSL